MSYVLLFILLIHNQASAEELSEDILNTDYYISYDLQNEKVLYSKNIEAKIYPASITKLMTAAVFLDYYSINETINTKFPEGYTYEGKVANIKENIDISVQNLLDLLLVYSANDAAYIAAMAVSDNVDDFISLMNKKSKSLGMTNTNFNNPDGLDNEDHYTTLNDLLILGKYVVQNKQIISTVSKSKFISNASGKEIKYENTNLLLNEGFTGIKTGWTDKAGLTLMGFNQLNNREIITIVNKSTVDENKYNHFSDSKILYKTSIESYGVYKIIQSNTYIYQIRNINNLQKHKSNMEWSVFINKNIKNSIKLNNYKNKTIFYEFGDDEISYKIKNNSHKVKWSFDPFKILKLIASQ